MGRKVVSVSPSKPANKPAFPFLFLNHGPLILESIGKCDGAYLGFKEPVPEALKGEIRRLCPAPICGSASFLDNLMSIETWGDTYCYELLEAFGTDEEKLELQENWPDVTQDCANRFSEAVDNWAHTVHQLAPLEFILGPGSTDPDDPWHKWSRARFTDVFIPFIDGFIARNPEIINQERGDSEMAEIQTLGHGHIACLLQEFDPYHALPVSGPHQARVSELIQTFDL